MGTARVKKRPPYIGYHILSHPNTQIVQNHDYTVTEVTNCQQTQRRQNPELQQTFGCRGWLETRANNKILMKS
eukprot:5226366-Amphidinium_carterae.1